MKHIVVIFLLSVVFSLEMLGSGWVTDKGLVLRGVNKTDGIWNIALIEELKHHFPPEHPGFARLPLKGYHFLFHGLVAIVSTATFIPVSFLYFQVFPLIISFLWGLGVYKTVILLTKNTLAAYISTVVSFFGGSFAFILHLIGQQQLSIDSGFGIAQPYGSSLTNPAYASSIVLVIWALYSFIRYLRTNERKWFLVLSVLSGLAIGFKAYAGMILLGALLVAGLARLIFEKKIDLLLCFSVAVTISIIVFYPFNGEYGFLVFAPFLHIIKMIEGPLSFTTWDESFHIQRSIGNTFGTAKLFTLVFIIFTVGNLGTRMLGIMGFITSLSKQSLSLLLYLLSLVSISLVIPIFFIQPTAGAFNIYQMHWYFLFFVSLFVGPGMLNMLHLFKTKIIRYIVVLFMIVLTIPSALNTLAGNISPVNAAIYPYQIELLNFLAQYGRYDDTVLEVPSLPTYQPESIENWFWNGSNVIITAQGKKRLYVAHEVVPYPYEARLERLPIYELFGDVLVSCQEKTDGCNESLDIFVHELESKSIRLIYVHKPNMIPQSNKLRLLKANETATIYEMLSL